MVSSELTSPLFNRRFAQNFWPIPATNPSRIGTLAPPFELLQAQTGQPLRLSDYVGSRSIDPERPEGLGRSRFVVLAFTRIFTEKHYCPLCYPHILAMNQAHDQFRQRGAEVLMITSTDDQQSQIVATDLGLTIPLLSDPSCRVFRMYQLGQALGAPLPAQFVVDRAGKVRFQHLFSFLEPNASVERLLNALEQPVITP